LSKDISTSYFERSTLIELLRGRATQRPDGRIYSFLNDGESEKDYLTLAGLDRQARALAVHLSEYAGTGERALLIYPSGLEFIAAFFGCLYSGIIAVPVYPPSAVRSDRNLARFRNIANDAQIAIILTTAALLSKVEGLLTLAPELQHTPVLVTDDLSTSAAEQWQRPAITSDTLAFLQYTSGSTGVPKGVMVSHGNLLYNSALVAHACQQPSDAHAVTWLPLYHDLGLIGGILQPLYSGYESTIMAPTAFLQRPIRWLQAISRTRATLSGGPNFAYDLCVRKITAEQKATLDLSSWVSAANGAEPVCAETLERFAAAFAPCGFRREALLPCYGLAEATLFVCGTRGSTVSTFDSKALEQHKAVETATEEANSHALVSLGSPPPEQKLVIVDTETLTQCPPGLVGEIWVSGASIAQGYWQHPEETAYTFRAHLADTGEGPFLRTGDLGFIHHGELFITGRLKDLIIIRGSNHYPQDIEQTAEHSHPAVRPNGSAAFSVDVDGEEQLVVVCEIERQYLRGNMDEIVGSIRQAIAEQHELQVYAVALIKPGSMPKTSSGKVQRRACRESFLKKSLDAVYQWTLDLTSAPLLLAVNEEHTKEPGGPAERPRPAAVRTKAAIQSWLVTRIAERLHINPRDLDSQIPLAHYGMDSVQAVSLTGDLETWLGRDLSPTLAYDYPTIESLARYLAGEMLEQATFPEEEREGETAVDAIAIIGIGCRFPGAPDPESFWQLLRDGKDAITEVPADRWDLQALYDPNRATLGKMHTRWGGFLQGVDLFDAPFFRISPREAAHMDPQQRLLLEVTWEALEHAGLAPDKLAGSETGVFIGISSNDYSQLRNSDPRLIDAYVGTGNAHSIAANRLSYFFDLRGPSIAIDTACSSSLVAVHQACQSLRDRECSMALAGGVNVILSPDLTIAFSQAQMMSSDGRCKTFDDDADGYVRAEGCGLVVLKPLSSALRDGDTVLAVLRGSAVNQDGRSNGLTAPNGLAQEAVIRRALYNASVSPEQISYVEMHGSSTPLGDPIEFESLKAVLMPKRSPDQTCVIASVKTNIGHLEAAAGIAGLIKVVLSLQHGEIPPHLHLKKLNRHISLNGTTFLISRERQAWPVSKRRLAGVSAFGFGGTNAHVIVEEAPGQILPINEVERPVHVLALSAQSKTALQALAGRYVTWLTANQGASAADISFSANTGRAHFTHRLAVMATTTGQLRERLEAYVTGGTPQGVQSGKLHNKERPRVAFLFTGQGSQYLGMGRQLYDTQPTFRHALERCDELLRPYLAQPLLSVLYPDPGISPPLHETAYTQPALFALEYALAELWRSWGIEPDVVMGHSVGEYVAAYVAGALSLQDGLKLIAERGRLMQELSQKGAMVTVFAEPARLEAVLTRFPGEVSIAAINGPNNTVISGQYEAILAIQRSLEAEGLIVHPMEVSHAFHSPLMDPILDAFERSASEIHLEPLRIPLISNLTGKMLNAGEVLDADYWRRQTREAVQFASGMRILAEYGCEIFLELGPTSTLLTMGKRCISGHVEAWLPSLQRGRDDWEMLLQAVGTLYVRGVEVDWQGFDRDYARRRVAVPTYPFERERCWLEPEEMEKAPVSKPLHRIPDRHPLLDSYTPLVYPTGIHIWETALDKQRLPYLNDHRIQGMMAVPISVYIEMIQAAAVEAFGPGAHMLKEIELEKLLLLPDQGEQKVQVVFASDAQKQVSFHVYSHSMGVPEQPRALWTLHMSGELLPN
jgi:acyl transferase domain-containing protein/acyl-CoA synthetase (AMP-forming)/AMP-acid ligase II/acyl carrier protein